MNYTKGDLIALPATFRDASTGELADPTTLAVRVGNPDGSTSTLAYPGAAIARLSIGSFTAQVAADQAGRYVYEWVLTGSLQGVEPGTFYVEDALPDAAAYRRVRADLAQMVAAQTEPQLDVEALDRLLRRARRPDSGCRPPSDPNWTPTFDLNAAAAEGWEMKAGLTAGLYNFAASGQRFDESQIHAQCLKMAELYSRGGGSVLVRAGALQDFADATVEGLLP